ncbi:hypothetical protein [Streptomyces sp. NBC_01465]|uniref:hypothetical protein n=1 Tax=Streptomyces sp. NBC_01465 TaxID=2903878 RepID=UPI002E2F165E|nr:hypothetical protein [Streptomyces sp. NBC_01465]
MRDYSGVFEQANHSLPLTLIGRIVWNVIDHVKNDQVALDLPQCPPTVFYVRLFIGLTGIPCHDTFARFVTRSGPCAQVSSVHGQNAFYQA